ncbi:AAA family ATPase [Lamprobacter modestohalophilus]|uniref:nSTAND1 domain-containing NTPase n=1 Tax=Lamprobacter modestohalophilus TaxID=1064514 RepID=UPI002ADEB175|nr:AAA family ATPase [Lamprobacter modestohalophilus]MEA1052368.1 AAA family ATPase [Lamprobacter modestohalophilus]
MSQPKLFLLLYDDGAKRGHALAVELQRYGADPDAPLITELNVASRDLGRAAERGAGLALALLRREGYRRNSLEVHFRLPQALPAIEGESAGLLFALAVIVRSLALPDPPNALAATGTLDEQGRVQPVVGVAEKLAAALEVLPAGGVLCYPWANVADVPPALLADADRRGIAVHAVERLDQAVARLGVAVRKLYVESPYRGLEAFTQAHAGIFFGRQRETQQLLDLLHARRAAQRGALLVVGASGSGKSSLVQAGLLPALIGESSAPSRFALLRPRQLGQGERLKALLATLWQQPDALGSEAAVPLILNGREQAAWLEAQRPGTHWILIVDQLEEVFGDTWSDARRRALAGYLDGLLAGTITVIGTLRADFMERFVTSPLWATFTNALNEGVYTLAMPGAQQLAAIVREPARQADLAFEPRHGIGLDERLLADAKGVGDVLPLLELTLTRLHEQRTPQGLLTQAAYEAIGGLHGAITEQAEAVFRAYCHCLQRRSNARHQKTGEKQAEQVLDRVLFQLVEPSQQPGRETARAVPLARFAEGTPERDLVEALRETRLLVLDQRATEPIVRLAHEAIFKHWPRARALVAQTQADRVLRQQLDAEQREWQAAGQPPAWDFPRVAGKRLADARDLLERRQGELEPSLSAYLQASIDQAQRRGQRKRRLLGSIAAVMTGLAIATGWQWWLAEERGTALEANLLESQRSTALAILGQAEQARRTDPALARDLLKTVQPDQRSWEWAFLVSLVGPTPRSIGSTDPLPAALRKEFSEWTQMASEHASNSSGQGWVQVDQRGPLESRWIEEHCGGCELLGVIERTDPITTLGGFQGVNRGRVPFLTASVDGSVGFLRIEQLPDRSGTTLDGDRLPGSGDFLLPLRNRVQLVSQRVRIPAAGEHCGSEQHDDAKALCLAIAAHGERSEETTWVQVKQLTDSVAFVETLSSQDYEYLYSYSLAQARLWQLEDLEAVPAVKLVQIMATQQEASVENIPESPTAQQSPMVADAETSRQPLTDLFRFADEADLSRSVDAWNRTACLRDAQAQFSGQEAWIGGLFETVSGSISVIQHSDGRWALWDCDQRRVLHTLGRPVAAPSTEAEGAGSFVPYQDRAVTVSHDGKRLAVYPIDEDYAVGIFEVATGRLVAKMLGANGVPRQFQAAMRSASTIISHSELLFSPGGRRLVFYGWGATGSEMSAVWELFGWDAETGELLFQRPQWRTRDPQGVVHHFAGPPERCHYYPDTCGEGAPYWDDETAVIEQPVPAGLVWAPEDSFVVLIEEDGPTRILEDLGGTQLAEFPKLYPDHPELLRPLALSISPDGSRVQIGNYIIDRERWDLLLNLHEPGKALWLSPDWSTAAVSDTSGLLEFRSLRFADQTVSDERLNWRDLMLRREFLNKPETKD